MPKKSRCPAGIKKAIVDLLKVKTLLSIIYSVTTCVLAFLGTINSETFVAITMAIITYYFTRKDL